MYGIVRSQGRFSGWEYLSRRSKRPDIPFTHKYHLLLVLKAWSRKKTVKQKMPFYDERLTDIIVIVCKL